MLSRPGGMLSRNDKPPDTRDTHGISGNVFFVNPTASSSSPYPGGFNPWISQRLGPGRRAKHLEVQTMWVQQLNKLGLISMNKLGTLENVADMMTEHVPRGILDKLAGMMGPGEETTTAVLRRGVEMSMLWQPYYIDDRDLLSCVTIDWETVWWWHAQIEKCDQVSSWMIFVKVVSLLVRWRMPSASLPFFVFSLFVLHAWCSGSVRVDCCAWCAVSVCWCTRHVCLLCSRLIPICFQIVSCWAWCIATSESWQDRFCRSAAKCDKHRELVGQRLFFIPHESESHCVTLHLHAWSLYLIIIYVIFFAIIYSLKNDVCKDKSISRLATTWSRWLIPTNPRQKDLMCCGFIRG